MPVGEPIPDAADGQNVTGVRGVLFDFLPKLANMNGHHPFDHHGVTPGVEPLQQFVPGENSAGCGHEGFQEGVFVRGEGDRLVLHAQPAFFQV